MLLWNGFLAHLALISLTFYPMTILAGENAEAEFTGITFAGKGQDLRYRS